MSQVTRGNSVPVPLTVNMPGLCRKREHVWDISITFFFTKRVRIKLYFEGKILVKIVKEKLSV